MIIKLEPINDNNRDAALALSVREDQPFVAPNDVSLRQADEANAEQPGTARPYAMPSMQMKSLWASACSYSILKTRTRTTATGSGAS